MRDATEVAENFTSLQVKWKTKFYYQFTPLKIIRDGKRVRGGQVKRNHFSSSSISYRYSVIFAKRIDSPTRVLRERERERDKKKKEKERRKKKART